MTLLRQSSLGTLLFLLLGAAAIAQPPTNGLVGYYPFNGNAFDASGNNRNGSVFGATLVDDRFGNSGAAYSFDGVGDSVSIPDNPAFQFRMTDDFSVSLWVKICDERNLFLPRMIIGHPPQHANNAGFFYISYVKNIILNQFVSAVNGVIPLIQGGSYDDEYWHHLVLVVDDNQQTPESNSTRTARFYVDGVQVATQTTNGQTTPARGTDNVVNDPIRIGSSIGYDSFKGAVDDVRLYDRVLTPTEITAIYQENGWPTNGPGSSLNITLEALGDTAICVGDTVDLRITGTYDSRQWTTSTEGLIDAESNSPRAAPTTPGTYTYKLTATKRNYIGPPCPRDTLVGREITIVVRESPRVSAPQIVACAQGSRRIATLTSGGAGGYRWSWSPATNLDDPNIERPTVTLDDNTPQSYTVTVTDALGCKTTGNVSITLLDPPTLDLVALQGADTSRVDTVYLCRGDDLELAALADGPEPTYVYEWQDPVGLDRTDSSHVRAAPSDPTLYRVTVRDRASICVRQDSVYVVPVDPPTIEAGEVPRICDGQSVLLGDATNDPDLRYAWTPRFGLDDSTLARPTANPSSTTTYYLRATDTTTDCSAIDSVVVTVTDAQPFVTPLSIDFGTLEGCRNDTTIKVLVGNRGRDTTILGRVEDPGGSVGVVGLPVTIGGGRSDSVTLRFAPSGLGTVSDTLLFVFGPCADTVRIPYTGTKNDAGGVGVEIVEADFGRVPWCEAQNLTRRIVVRNNGTEDATVYPTWLEPPSPGNILSISSGVLPRVLGDGDSVVLTVSFTPRGAAIASGVIRIPYQSGSCIDTLEVNVRAESYIPNLTSIPNRASFGLLDGCTTDREVTLDLRNEEIDSVGITSIEVPAGVTLLDRPDGVDSAATEQIRLRWAPSGTGSIGGFIRVIYGPCDDTLSIPVDGEKRGVTVTTNDTIEFGTNCVNDLVDRLSGILVDSEGTGDGSVLEVRVTGPFSTDIAVGDILSDGQSEDFTVRFAPTSEGDFVGELYLRLDPCDVERRIVLIGRAIRSDVEVVPLDFGTVQSGSTRIDRIAWVNRASSAIRIGSLDEISGFADGTFRVLSTSPPMPADLAQGDTLFVEIEYRATSDTSRAELGAVIVSVCDTTITGEIIGVGTFDSLASTRVIIGDLTGEPGDRVDLELRLENPSALGTRPITGFEATIGVEASMLVVGDASTPWQLVGNERIFEIAGGYTAGDPVLARIPSVILLGRFEQTDLRLVDFRFVGDTSVAIERVDGELTMTGLCREGGIRLFDPTGSVAIRAVTPNPTSGSIRVAYSVIESGSHRMDLVDLTGRTVRTLFDGLLLPGTYGLESTLDGVASGTYRLVLQTPTMRLSEEVRVVE